MTVSNGDILQVVMEVTLDDGSIAQNVYELESQLASTYGDSTVVDAIEVWIEDMYDELSAQLVDSITQNLCTVKVKEWNASLGLWETTRDVGSFVPGTTFSNVGEALPNQSSAFATFNTFLPRSRGRKFLFPFGEDQQAGTFLIAAAVTAMVAYADVLLDGIFLGPANNLVPGITRVAFDDFRQFLVGIVTNILGSQRRRRPQVGI